MSLISIIKDKYAQLSRMKPRFFENPHPSDINWSEIKVRAGSRACMQLLLLIVSTLTLLFLTTPTALINVASGSSQMKSALSFGWVQTLPAFLASLLRSVLPPLLVVAINQILLLIIEKVVSLEGHHRFSFYQKGLLQTVFIYFLFNMLIVPGFAATAITNLVELLQMGLKDFSSLFRNLFVLKTGDFFINLLVQSGSVAVLTSFSNIAPLFGYYLSPLFMMSIRMKQFGGEVWTKENSNIFPFGVSYALNLVTIGIAVVFQ